MSLVFVYFYYLDHDPVFQLEGNFKLIFGSFNLRHADLFGATGEMHDCKVSQ